MANFNVQEAKLINSRPVTVSYMGLPLTLDTFPDEMNPSGVAGMGAADLIVHMLASWFPFIAGCGE